MEKYWPIEIPSGVLDRVEIEWLFKNATDTYSVRTLEKWDTGEVDGSIMYLHTTLVIYFSSRDDAIHFKLQYNDGLEASERDL